LVPAAVVRSNSTTKFRSEKCGAAIRKTNRGARNGAKRLKNARIESIRDAFLSHSTHKIAEKLRNRTRERV
jgi:hypothetical protein